MLSGFSFILGLLPVALLIEAEPSAMEQGVQRLLLSLSWQAAQALGTSLGVHPTRLTFGQGTGHAASTAGLLHQLTAHWAGRAHGEGFLVARFTVHERAQALCKPQAQAQEEDLPQEHLQATARCSVVASNPIQD